MRDVTAPVNDADHASIWPAPSPAGNPNRLPFTTVAGAVEWWYSPLVASHTWVAAAYLLVGALWAPFIFTAAVVVMAVTFGLTFVGLGLLLIVPAFGMLNALASVERSRAGWVGEPIPARILTTNAGGLWSSIRTRLGDGGRWQQVLFLWLFIAAGPLLCAIAVAPWIFLIGFAFDGVGQFVLAALLAGVLPRTTLLVARVGRSFTASLLGPDRNVVLQARVAELAAQRQQILEAVGGERRRIERNLHDGVQQQLVALGIDIGRAKARLENDPDGARRLLEQASDKVRGSIGELRLIGRGLHPAVLEDRGLDAALSAVVAHSPIPISVDVSSDLALAADVAATAYYVASEAVANMLKHSDARIGSIHVQHEGGPTPAIRMTIHDDGRGGIDPSRGSGLAGMRARVEAMDGTLTVQSPTGGPTTLIVVLPLDTPNRSSLAGRSA